MRSLSAVPLLGAATLCLSCVALSQKQKPDPKRPPKPPIAEKITDNIYRIGTVTLDRKARTVTFPAMVNMTQGAIEYLAVTCDGKTHESLLMVRARPLHIQLALILIGLEPRNVLERQGDPKKPEGDPVEIWLRWRDPKGEMRETRAEEWIARRADEKAMPAHVWAFTGSRILREGFEADISGSIVAVWHDPAAILDNPLPEGAENIWVANSRRTPKRGTRLDMVLKAATAEPTTSLPKKSAP